jgi:hypothetical protein
MNRKNLIPPVTTDDLDPKEPWPQEGADKPEGREVQTTDHEESKLENQEPKSGRSLWVKAVLAFIIIGAIIGIGILLPIKLIPSASSIIASVFSPGKSGDSAQTKNNPASQSSSTNQEAFAFKTDKSTLQSGDSILISWNGPVRNDGVYELAYPCSSGTDVTLIAADGTKPAVTCGQDFRFISLDNTMTLSIVSKYQRLSEVPISFSFTNASNTVEQLGNVKLSVANNSPIAATGSATGNQVASGNGSQTSSQASLTSGGGRTYFQSAAVTKANATNGSAGSSSNVNGTGAASSQQGGSPDLVVRVISISRVDPATRASIPGTTFFPGDTASIQFEIVNVGTGASGAWRFQAELPTFDSKLFQSDIEPSLSPGGKIVFVLGFDGLANASANSAVIVADPGKTVNDAARGNNTATVMFQMSASNAYNNGNNYYYNYNNYTRSAPDLSVELVGNGTIRNGGFVETDNLYSGDTIAVQFKVTNIGGTETSNWNYEAMISRNTSDYVYRSDNQNSLAPGESATETVTFSNITTPGTHDITIDVDPMHNVDDSNTSNNSIDVSVYLRQ